MKNGSKSLISNGKSNQKMNIQFQNENEKPFENWSESPERFEKWWIKTTKIHIENVNENTNL